MPKTATYTHENTDAGHLYQFRLTDAQPPPYITQREVRAIIDIADDGTLAGVELFDNMPPPPVQK